jgi:HD-GYP domain-containing protein (c-di-GMP phosphodiesterase class II)
MPLAASLLSSFPQIGNAPFTEVVRALVNAVEARDPYTCGHSERVPFYARRLGEEVGLDRESCDKIHLSGLLHDVGKIAVSDATLRKPGRLTDKEFEEISQHPNQGWAILHDLVHLRDIMPGVLYHHERFDGKGYPLGLVGEAIPLEGRIMAICDAYDAMTSDRPYRKGMSQEKAEAILRGGAESQWDPRLLKAFFQAMPDILRIRSNYRPRMHSAPLALPTAD